MASSDQSSPNLRPAESSTSPASSSQSVSESQPAVEAQQSSSQPDTPEVKFVNPKTESPPATPQRPTSIQFVTSDRVPLPEKPESSIENLGKPKGRLPSPPPLPSPPTYTSRVSFDTVAWESTDKPAFTRTFRHPDYSPQKHSKTFCCGIDESEYAAAALEYLIEELVDNGDDIVCVRVVENRGQHREEAAKVQESVQAALDTNKGPGVKVVIEIIVGKVRESLDRMVNLHRPVNIVVGTQGKSLTESKFGKNSISYYLYQCCPVPVVIVRPKEKRLKNLTKRQKDPGRQKYLELLRHDPEQSETAIGTPLKDPEDERAAVARAIGLLNPTEQRPGSSASSRSPRLALDESRENEDDEDGAPLLRMSSRTGNYAYVEGVDVNIIDEEGNVVETDRFESMPNYVPGLDGAHDEDQTSEQVNDAAEGTPSPSQDKGKGKEV
ncbi:uncharacterized protein KY384_005479 [Bacidia gigantensis]|uniref:uncharacterized protein n=1 Tax=Bacidia gigantensis TaxID=2732470 RepID=UPI001D042B74|nr:uncharacterized protein KY384_005479 [Bacidia gigantensis]KAG8529997.1 hypothetical protein KY384_005479 [Bacidia gigantensis]